MAEETRPRLGRGLAALLGNDASDAESLAGHRALRRISVAVIAANPHNPRKHFSEDDLAELVESVKKRGVLQPIVVRGIKGSTAQFEIVAGERRWRAAQKAGLHDLPALVVHADDKTALEIAIVENVQRSDLSPLEEASGYDHLIAEHQYTQADLADVIGKSRSHIANSLRLLKLSERAKSFLESGQITAGHARALLAVSNPEKVAEDIVQKGLSVRDVEQLGKAAQKKNSGTAAQSRPAPDLEGAELARSLSEHLGLSVSINRKGERGSVAIEYKSLEQLDELCRLLRAGA